jgi:hypothetical protein
MTVMTEEDLIGALVAAVPPPFLPLESRMHRLRGEAQRVSKAYDAEAKW